MYANQRDRASKSLRASALLRVASRDYYHHGRKKDGKATARHVQVIQAVLAMALSLLDSGPSADTRLPSAYHGAM